MKLLQLKVVLAAIDRDEMSSAVLQSARELATAAGARLHVINVVRLNAPQRDVPREGGSDAELERLLHRASVPAGEAGIHVVRGEAAREIRSLATTVSADVIVLGRHHTGAEPLGSTAMRVVTNAEAPCLIISAPMTLPLERVLVPVDLSETARGALLLALSWASALRGAEKSAGSAAGEPANLTALLVDQQRHAGDAHSVTPEPLEDEVRRLREDAGTWASVAIDGVTVAGGDVAATIAKYADQHQSDLVVLGTRGLGADSVRRIGSVSEQVMRQAGVPILLVPPAIWSSEQLSKPIGGANARS
ncbi:MAG TPA: universal stress protein [Gemmatimonadaceae bacterium]|nr:universal stress protein [Gemmatimonadaceae bacterium]